MAAELACQSKCDGLPAPSSDDIRLVSWNVGGWLSRVEDILAYLMEHRPHVMMLQEVHP